VPQIDPSSSVANGARLAGDVEIGPFCTIGPQVQLNSGVRLLSHVSVTGVTAIGEKTVVYPFASIGSAPQSTAYRGGDTRLTIGAQCLIREGVTISTGTEDFGALTSIGDRCFLMANSHVGHDCRIGNDVTFANGAVLGGHVVVGNGVFIGGNAAVHQFCRIGEGAMLAGLSGVAADIIPFGFALGQRAELVGLNVVGLRRQKFSRSDIHRFRTAYRALFLDDGNFTARFERVAGEYGTDPLIGKVVAFIRNRGKRPLMTPAATGEDREPPEA
jgi:UDP-N-acetylglucosamine acyltransferase